MGAVLWCCVALTVGTFALEVALLFGVVLPAAAYVAYFCVAVLLAFVGALNHRQSTQTGGYIQAELFSLFKTAHRWVAALFGLSIAVFIFWAVAVMRSDAPSRLTITTENMARYPAAGRLLLAILGVVSGWGAALASSTLRERHGP